MKLFKQSRNEWIGTGLLLVALIGFFLSGVMDHYTSPGFMEDGLTAQGLPPQPGTPPATVSFTNISTVVPTNVAILAASTSNLRYVITSASCVNTSASVGAANISAGTTAIYTLPCPLSGAGGGQINFVPPMAMTRTNMSVGTNLITGLSTGYITLGYYQTR